MTDGSGKRRVIVFSGAGLSAESGLKTYRDHDGLWENHRIEDVATADAFRAHPNRVHRFMSDRRMELATVKPNAAHEGIAALERLYSVINITQNIDDLLERAGCGTVVHLHGYLPEIRCLGCGHVWDIGYADYDHHPCPKCRSKKTKPNIVLFGDSAPLYQVLHQLFFPTSRAEALSERDVVVVIGTMGNVVPIGRYLSGQACVKIVNNLDDSAFVPAASFDHAFLEPATSAIGKIAEVLRALP